MVQEDPKEPDKIRDGHVDGVVEPAPQQCSIASGRAVNAVAFPATIARDRERRALHEGSIPPDVFTRKRRHVCDRLMFIIGNI